MTITAHNCSERKLELFDSILTMFQVLYAALDWLPVEDYASRLRHELRMSSHFGPRLQLPDESQDAQIEQAKGIYESSSTDEGQLVMTAFAQACAHHRTEGC